MGKGMSSASGSRLNSHTRLFLLFKSRREAIGGKDGKIPRHLFRQRHSRRSGPACSDLPFSQGYRRHLGALCVHRGAPAKPPPRRRRTDGVVILYDDVLCMCVYTFLCGSLMFNSHLLHN